MYGDFMPYLLFNMLYDGKMIISENFVFIETGLCVKTAENFINYRYKNDNLLGLLTS